VAGEETITVSSKTTRYICDVIDCVSIHDTARGLAIHRQLFVSLVATPVQFLHKQNGTGSVSSPQTAVDFAGDNTSGNFYILASQITHRLALIPRIGTSHFTTSHLALYPRPSTLLKLT